MEPKIISHRNLLLAGLSFYGDPFEARGFWEQENEIGRLWARFFRLLGEDVRVETPPGAGNTAYEVHIYNEETLEKGLFEVFVGVEVAQADTTSLELVVKALPETEYAVFTLHGEKILSDWPLSIDQWTGEAGYRRRYPYSVQVYDERFKGMDRISESTLDVYMPVERAG